MMSVTLRSLFPAGRIRLVLIFVFLLGLASALSAQPVRVDAVTAELVAEQTAAVPGQRLRLGLRLNHDAGWHTYWRNAGDSGLPTQLELRLPPGWSSEGLQWPAPQRIRVGPLANFGYEGEVLLPVLVQVPAQARIGEVARIEGLASWLVCREICVPGQAALALQVPIAAASAATAAQAAFKSADASIPDPAKALEATWTIAERRLQLVFDPPAGKTNSVRQFTFYPYRERVAAPAADQHLERLADGRWRIDLEVAQDADLASLDLATASARALNGLLVVDDHSVELHATRGVAATLAPGQRLLTAHLPASAPSSSGLMQRLQSESDLADQGSSTPASRPSAQALLASGGVLAAASAFDLMSVLLMLLGALLGGLILNLMPCVFPVVGLKVLGFIRDAGGNARVARRNALAFAGGVITAFVLLAGLMLALRAAGQAIGWGFQLQTPWVVMLLALLFLAIGLNFSGVFEMGLGLTTLGAQGAAPVQPIGAAAGKAGAAQEEAVILKSVFPSFAAGLLAAVVATPCTAPFMGAAVGFTLTSGPWLALPVFATLGLGMAAPYILLGLRPALLAHLPRPGRWMQTLRQGLAFPMYATAVWLLWVLGVQLGVDAMLRVGLAAVLIGAAAWWWGRQQAVGGLRAALPVVILVGLALILAWPEQESPAIATTQSGAPQSGVGGDVDVAEVAQTLRWQPWSLAALQSARASGKTVFVDFTAAWCISCQANKHVVLENQTVRRAFSERAVVLLRADWTRRDAQITAALAEYGRNGVPLYLVFRPDMPQATVLPELLTTATVLTALNPLMR